MNGLKRLLAMALAMLLLILPAAMAEENTATAHTLTISNIAVNAAGVDLLDLEGLSVEMTAADTGDAVEFVLRLLGGEDAAAEGYALSKVSDALEEALDGYAPPSGCTVSLSGENETVRSIMDDLVLVIAVALVFIFLIMVAQFQSFKSPIIVMFTIPLAFTGGLLALLITGLDLSVQAKVLDLIRKIRSRYNISIILVSHDLAVIRMLADRTMVMLDGQVVESGLTDQILEDPQHAYTQQLVHSLL